MDRYGMVWDRTTISTDKDGKPEPIPLAQALHEAEVKFRGRISGLHALPIDSPQIVGTLDDETHVEGHPWYVIAQRHTV